MPRSRRDADEALLLALACGSTVENAARGAGISRRTAHRRLEDQEFQKKLRAFRTDMVERTGGMLTAGSLEAGKTLLSLQDPATPAGVRLGAARAFLEFSIRMRDSEEFERRLAALEERDRQKGGADA